MTLSRRRQLWQQLSSLARKLRAVALDRGLPSAIGSAGRWLFAVPAASIYRVIVLRRVVFIAVTGSTAKSTTKELIAAILGRRLKGRKTEFSNNLPRTIAGTILMVRPSDAFCVVEVAAAIGGSKVPLEKVLSLVRPKIAVVTNIGTDHQSAFGSVDNIAEAKSKLVEAVPANGVAILNADDQRVAAMEGKCEGRVAWYGLKAGSHVMASNIRSNWPDRLSFDLSYIGQSYSIRTRFCGEFWVHSILAAISVGIEMGVPMAEIVETIIEIDPYPRRMEPVPREDGVTFIRDDQKTPITSIPLALRFLECAQATHKIVVFGTISDYKGNSDRMYVSVAKQALAVADRVIFIGPRAKKSLKAGKDHPSGTIQAFLHVDAAAAYLGTFLQAGDLVLLKGTNRDNLASLARSLPRSIAEPAERQAAASPVSERVRCVVGLGNVGERYEDTPHNIGQKVVDLMAHSFQARWAEADDASVAELNDGNPVYLIKLKTSVNRSGRALLRVADRLGVSASQCVIVHDDADLPFGEVRMRPNGSDGGHRGVRSILNELGTDEIRRIKLGVGSSISTAALAERVVASVAPGDRKKVDDACAEAVRMLTAIVSEMQGGTAADGADGRTRTSNLLDTN